MAGQRRDLKVSAPESREVSVIFRRRILSGSGIKVPTTLTSIKMGEFLFAGRTKKFPTIRIHVCGFFFTESLPTLMNTRLFIPRCAQWDTCARMFRHCSSVTEKKIRLCQDFMARHCTNNCEPWAQTRLTG